MAELDLPQIPGYAVQGVLARGGMAVVFSALELATRRPVALKRILPDVAEDPEFLDRFRHEVRIHSQLAHPNVLALHGYGTGPEFYLAMELVEGGSLRDLMNRAGKLPPELACFAAAEVLRGLSCAHDRGIVHRDMKPQNVLVTRNGVLKVADFGISKTSQMTRLTQTGQVVGTPAYMSPEQAMAHPLDPRSDVFSVGVMLYEMLTGLNPFLTDNPATTLRMIVDRDPPPLFNVDPTVPIECERLVSRMLEKEPSRRVSSAALAARALDERVAALGLTKPLEAFKQHLADPRKALKERNERLSRAHLATARILRAEKGSSVEVVLWEAFLATLLDRANLDAKSLVAALTAETGYTLDGSSARARTLELEARVAEEPDDPNVLLSAAKAAKIDRDFLRTMRFFFRLRSLPIDDPYLLGQIASLVGKPGARPPAATEPPRPPAPPAEPPRRPAAASAAGAETRRTPPSAGALPLPPPARVAPPVRPPPDPHATRRLAAGAEAARLPEGTPRLSRAAVVAAAVGTGALVYVLVRLLLS